MMTMADIAAMTAAMAAVTMMSTRKRRDRRQPDRRRQHRDEKSLAHATSLQSPKAKVAIGPIDAFIRVCDVNRL